MTETAQEVRDVVGQALTGRGAHVLIREGLDGLGWEQAGALPDGGAHTVFQIVNHLTYWQDFSLAWIDGDKPVTPEHAEESWPGDEAPKGEARWESSVAAFQAGLRALEKVARERDLLGSRGPKTVLEILQLIASHNSYHMGQIAWARQAMGAWPPPGGGATW